MKTADITTVRSGDTLVAGACGISRARNHHREPPNVGVLAQNRLAGAVHVTNTFVIASKD
jgi:hypothetical protein